MLKIEYLPWDSDLFQLKVGKLVITADHSEDEIIVAIENAKDNYYEVVYVFVNNSISFNTTIVEKFYGKLVDTKVIYQIDLHAITIDSNNVSENYKGLPRALYDLAFQSGAYSRFKKDEKFGKNKFENLYKTWINNSISGQMADYVCAVHADNKIIGFGTVKITDNIGTIGLISVDNSYRRQGVGKQLMYNIFGFLKTIGINKLEVSTQNENVQACKFYESYKMKVKNKINVYHIWLKTI